MLQVNDVRETRVFQEALEEGREKGKEEGREEGKRIGELAAKEAMARRLLARKVGHKEIAELVGLSVSQIMKLHKKQED